VPETGNFGNQILAERPAENSEFFLRRKVFERKDTQDNVMIVLHSRGKDILF
jgi:hypothetical protein